MCFSEHFLARKTRTKRLRQKKKARMLIETSPRWWRGGPCWARKARTPRLMQKKARTTKKDLSVTSL